MNRDEIRYEGLGSAHQKGRGWAVLCAGYGSSWHAEIQICMYVVRGQREANVSRLRVQAREGGWVRKTMVMSYIPQSTYVRRYKVHM